MKLLGLMIFLQLFLSFSCQSEVAKPTEMKNTNSTQSSENKLNDIVKDPEDCDDKAKKVIEVKPETISLGGGDTGCSLDDL